jgi:hypothetical protein
VKRVIVLLGLYNFHGRLKAGAYLLIAQRVRRIGRQLAANFQQVGDKIVRFRLGNGHNGMLFERFDPHHIRRDLQPRQLVVH